MSFTFTAVSFCQPLIDLDDNYPEGTLCWLETPVNPTGESRDMQHCKVLYSVRSAPNGSWEWPVES